MTWRRSYTLVLITAAIALLSLGRASGATALQGNEPFYTWPGATIVHVTNEPEGAGSVQSTPYLIDCPFYCNEPADPGTKLTLTATPSVGFEFAGWTGACAGSANPCELTVGSTADVAAHYLYVGVPQLEIGGPVLTVKIVSLYDIGAAVFDAYGKIACGRGAFGESVLVGPSSCRATYARGQFVELDETAGPGANYEIEGCDQTFDFGNSSICLVTMNGSRTITYIVA